MTNPDRPPVNEPPVSATRSDGPVNDRARELLVKHMVDRFLMWKLPEHFRPDDGISFDPISNRGTRYERRREPVGTNLFDADQATAMVRHMLEGAFLAEPAETKVTAEQLAYERLSRSNGWPSWASMDAASRRRATEGVPNLVAKMRAALAAANTTTSTEPNPDKGEASK